MRHVVVGTAGHIDHGKTALVRALTGVDTDRLPEEKRRGITIELGFAPWPLADGVHASIVDVPGHERLVHTMVAGATGIDLALLCVAADDGVMPQTREHLDVLALLGVPRGLVVLTKCDLAEPEVLALVEADVAAAVQGTIFEGTRPIRTSSRTGAGLDELGAAVAAATRELPERDATGPAFLPLDRVFQKHGFGTVVTGTVARGTLAVGDALLALGERESPLEGLKARGLQSSGAPVERVGAGVRAAVNVAGREVAALTRGMVLTNAPSGPLSTACLASIRLLPHAAPLSDEELTLHVGTCERVARVLPLGVASLAPGTTGPVLLHLSVPVATFAGQRVILRRSGLSHGATVAGGEILDPLPPRSKGAPRRLAPLAAELARSGRGRLEALAMAARADGLTRAELTWRLPPGGARGALEALTRSGELVAVGERLVHRTFIEEASRELVSLVVEHARDNPLSGGLPEQELLTRLVPPLRPLVPQALALAKEKGRLELAGATVRLPSQAPGAAAARPEATRLLGFYREQRFTPPTDDEAVLALGQPAKRVQDLLAALRRDGLLIKVATGLHYDPAAIEEITQRVLAALHEKPELTAGDFKGLLGGVSRKYAIPLLEFLDHGRVTMRVGNNRKLHPSRRT